jgi:hypothetical protein
MLPMLETVITLTLVSPVIPPSAAIYRYAEVPAETRPARLPTTGAIQRPTLAPRSAMSTSVDTRASNDFQRMLAIQKIEGLLETFRSMDAGWDGYSAERVKDEAINQATVFLQLIPDSIPIPKVTLSSNGEISFYWKQNDAYAEIGLDGDGTYYYFADIAGKRFGADNLQIGGHPFPEQLTKSIAVLR